MKRLILLIAAFAAVTGCNRFNPSDYVNPNIGTDHSRWFFYTPAAVPFGMAKLGASTNGTYGNVNGWEAVGYEDAHGSIDGFPCLHEFQVGGVSLMPAVGTVKTVPGTLENPDEGFRSRFEKADEFAKPGYYTVVLGDYGVKVELTATERVGFQRYTFPASEASHIIFNIGNRQGESGAVKDAGIELKDGNIVQGYVITEPEYVKKYQAGATVAMYFYAVLDKTPLSSSVFVQGGEPSEGNAIHGAGSMMCLNYATSESESICVKIGLSYTSVENAKLNLETEAADMDFDKAHKEAVAKWDEELGKIEVYGGSEESRIKFYTGLYHALLGRGIASDVNGAYPKNDGTIGQIALENGKPVHGLYNTDAVWGAYWNLTPLWALAYPEYYGEFINSQLLVYEDAGWLGDGIANSKYVSGVGTNMVSIAIAGAYNSGIRNYDIEKAYAAALKNELCSENRIEGAGKIDVGSFVERGYVPYADIQAFDGSGRKASAFSISHTLEYSFSAYAVSQLAKSLGREDDYRQLYELSSGWAKVFDDSLKLVRPRYENGEFIENFDPYESWRGFQEGNAMQYTFFVPQDPEGLVERMGRDVFNERLDGIFTQARETIFGGGKELFAFSGLRSPYNHGNQPSLHISWLFNFSGKPYLTQKWTRLICDEFYGTTHEHGYGYGQDEDQGQLGAWYVMAAMGLFDVQGGSSSRPTYQLGSPQFDKIVIKLSPLNASGKKFVIKARNNSKDAYYVQKATLNGKALGNCWLYRDEVYKGGELVLEMGTEPNENWGADCPPYYSK